MKHTRTLRLWIIVSLSLITSSHACTSDRQITTNAKIEASEPHTCKDGKDGRDGKDGKDGRDGKAGAPGIAGKDGKDGAPGKDGPPCQCTTQHTKCPEAAHCDKCPTTEQHCRPQGAARCPSDSPPIGFSDALRFSAETMGLLKPNTVYLGEGLTWLRLWSWAQAVAGPSLFTMFVLALKNKLKR